MPSPVSLVDNLRPMSRVQPRPVDLVLRATTTPNQRTYQGNSTMLQWEMSAFASYTLQFVGDSNAFAIEGSNDLATWGAVDCWSLGRNLAPIGQGGQGGTGTGLSFMQENNGPTLIGGNRQTRFMRIRVATGSPSRFGAVQALLSQNPLHPPRNPLLGPDDIWTYAAVAGGIVNSTAVVIKAALNTSHRNVLTRLQLSNGGGTGTEVILTDSGGTLWRDYLAAGASKTVDFNPPLRAAANSALSITLSAATGAAVYANAQGVVGLA